MNIDGHYDPRADIAWLRFDGFDPRAAVSEETEFGLRDVIDGRVVGLEFWKASDRLPGELLAALPRPPVQVVGGAS